MWLYREKARPEFLSSITDGLSATKLSFTFPEVWVHLHFPFFFFFKFTV